MDNLAGALAVFNQFVVVAVVINAASLLLYTFTFNLKDRVAQALNVLLACVAVAYLGDVGASVARGAAAAGAWLRFQWLGISLVPAAYLHLSDALLEKTGKPSRGRRRFLVRLAYAGGLGSVGLAHFSGRVVGQPIVGERLQWLQPGDLFAPFALAFAFVTLVAIVNIYRAFLRCLTRATRRRMGYLLISSLAVPLGVFPYLMPAGAGAAQSYPLLFWLAALAANVAVSVALVWMTYSVAFFGAPQPDRVVKGRLFQWILRGPMVASLAVGAYVFVRWLDRIAGLDLTLWVPVAVVGVILLAQYAITVVRLPLERRFFYGNISDQDDVQRLQLLGDRLLTKGDVQQFLESVLAAACDVLHISSGFVAVMGRAGARIEVRVGSRQPPTESATLAAIVRPDARDASAVEFSLSAGAGRLEWEGYWIIPLRGEKLAGTARQASEVLGLMGLHVPGKAIPVQGDDEMETLQTLVTRAATALEDRRLQSNVFRAMGDLLPQVDELQRMRAAARYAGTRALEAGDIARNPDAAQWVKDALRHFWGGPRLSESPLLRLKVVEKALSEHDGNPVNALRAVLKNAIEQIKPEGQRKFTGEWLLYNILELKFLQGQKVRDVAMRLAVSEADLYRKQRVAVEEVLKRIAQMEVQMDASGENEQLVSG